MGGARIDRAYTGAVHGGSEEAQGLQVLDGTLGGSLHGRGLHTDLAKKIAELTAPPAALLSVTANAVAEKGRAAVLLVAEDLLGDFDIRWGDGTDVFWGP